MIWRRLFSIVIESAYYELVCYKKVLALSQADGISVRFDDVAKVKAVLKRHFKKNMGFVPELPDTEESPITPQKGIAELFPLE